jgi:hypothetical protein
MKKIIIMAALCCFTSVATIAQTVTINSLAGICGDVIVSIEARDGSCNVVGTTIDFYIAVGTTGFSPNLALGANWMGGTAPAPGYDLSYVTVKNACANPFGTTSGSCPSGYAEQVTIGLGTCPFTYASSDCFEHTSACLTCGVTSIITGTCSGSTTSLTVDVN